MDVCSDKKAKRCLNLLSQLDVNTYVVGRAKHELSQARLELEHKRQGITVLLYTSC